MKRVQRVRNLIPAMMLCVMSSACDTYYRYESTGQDTGRIAVAGSSYLWDLLVFGILVAAALLYPVIYRNITHQEIGRRRGFALRGVIGLIAAAFFYNRTYYNLKHTWEVDAKGVRELTMYGQQQMLWDDAYRVWADRQNVRDVTKDLRIPSPMFMAVGPENRAVVVREEEVGHEAFEGFAKLALDLYFRRDQLWKATPKDGGTGGAAPVDAEKADAGKPAAVAVPAETQPPKPVK